VTVNGRSASLGESAETGSDLVCVDGVPLVVRESRTYIAMNKPAGYACTRRDPHLPHTVYHLLPRELERLMSVGRLDVDTEGLLLLTDDGEWANSIAHPARHVPKTYVAEVDGRVLPEHLAALRRGIDLDDGPTQPATVRLVRFRPSEGVSLVELTVTEGRKRQVKRMFGALGLSVRHLERVSVGPVALGALPRGAFRRLSDDEVAALTHEGTE
jgi:23S rRNA pseudouridine2605 synthase